MEKAKEFAKNGEKLLFDSELKNDHIWSGKQKGYNNDNWTYFDGVYINRRKWCGKFSQYFYGGQQIEYKCEYYCGYKNGFYEEYYESGQLRFKAEYLNGVLNGKILAYHKNGKLDYEGEYVNGKLKGKGKEYFDNGQLKFEGEYLNDEKWNGKIFDKNGVFSGEIVNGKQNLIEKK